MAIKKKSKFEKENPYWPTLLEGGSYYYHPGLKLMFYDFKTRLLPEG